MFYNNKEDIWFFPVSPPPRKIIRAIRAIRVNPNANPSPNPNPNSPNHNFSWGRTNNRKEPDILPLLFNSFVCLNMEK